MSKYHNILGVDKNASKSEIKKAYRAKAMSVHPDVNSSPEAQKLFIELAEAYDILFNENHNIADKKITTKKYWDVYQPPSDNREFEKWKAVDKERKEFYRKKAKEEAIKRKQIFEMEVLKFRNSKFFYPIMFFYYTILALFYSCAIGSVCVPIYIKWNSQLYNFSDDIILVMGTCTLAVSFSLFLAIKQLKKQLILIFFL